MLPPAVGRPGQSAAEERILVQFRIKVAHLAAAAFINFYDG